MPVLKLLETGFQPPASTVALTHVVTTINHYHHHNRQVPIPAGTINSVWPGLTGKEKAETQTAAATTTTTTYHKAKKQVPLPVDEINGMRFELISAV